jgi:hypothetical protein
MLITIFTVDSHGDLQLLLYLAKGYSRLGTLVE